MATVKYPHHAELGLLLIRIALAAVFITHGWLKLSNLEGTTAFFSSIGLASFWVYVVALVEFVGGLALLVGFQARLAGWLLAVNMLVAIFLVRFKMGFVGGYEFELVLLLAALGLAFTGPGKYAVSQK